MPELLQVRGVAKTFDGQDGQVALCGFVEPFDTWADMRHLIGRETWARPPRALGYFCSVLLDDESVAVRNGDRLAAERERVRRHAVHFLNHEVPHLWPRATRVPGEFRWDLLSDPDGTWAEAVGEAPAHATPPRFASAATASSAFFAALAISSLWRAGPMSATYSIPSEYTGGTYGGMT